MSDSRKANWLRRVVAALVVTGVGAAVIWGFLEGRNERSIEATREAPIKAPLRVSTVGGETTITLDNETQQNGGIRIVQLQSAANQAQVQAYGTVLDLQPLTELSNSYTTSKAQLQTAQAKLNASRMAFERAQRLYQDQQNISAAQLQAAEANFRVDEASVAASETQLQNLASSALQQWGTVLGRALVDRAPILLRLLQRQDLLVQVLLQGERRRRPSSRDECRRDAVIRKGGKWLADSRVCRRVVTRQGVGLFPPRRTDLRAPRNCNGSAGRRWGLFRQRTPQLG